MQVIRKGFLYELEYDPEHTLIDPLFVLPPELTAASLVQETRSSRTDKQELPRAMT